MNILNQGDWVSRYLQNAPIAHFTELLYKLHSRYYLPASNHFDYRTLKNSDDYQQLLLVTRALARVKPGNLESLSERMCFWLNLYNSLTIHIVTSEGISDKLSQHKKFYSEYAYQIDGQGFTLDDIEHGILRGNRKTYGGFRQPFADRDPRRKLILDGTDPRIHFAMYTACASSCQWQVFKPETLQAQLKVATDSYLQKHSNFEPDKLRINLPKVFQWYAGDFGNRHQLVQFVLEHSSDPLLHNWSKQGHSDELKPAYKDFDWQVNQADRASAPLAQATEA